jgi:hypothetical protein
MVGSIIKLSRRIKMNEFFEGLTEYKVTVIEDESITNDTIFFECWAENMEHAEEQALNAYPLSVIIHIEPV